MPTIVAPDSVDQQKLLNQVKQYGDARLKHVAESPTHRLVVSHPMQQDSNGNYNPNLERYVEVTIFRDGRQEYTLPLQIPFHLVAK